MTESLDGGAVTYRSNRHFDILNENIIFPFQAASNASDYRGIFDGRRSAYGQGLVLLNNMSHDEQAYANPYEALIRFGVASTVDGIPMVYYGQENGISGPSAGPRDKLRFQSLRDQLRQTRRALQRVQRSGPDSRQPGQRRAIFEASYAAINQARQFSRALRSSNRYYLNQTDNSVQQKIFSVAKYETANTSPGPVRCRLCLCES